ncbi:DNA replication protein [Haloferax sp. DFSO52]|uniref:DNA replication protein n=1 Tax=Haloferax sp. DFSO52 TaxID=3388505 RepID=UPI003A838516
MNVDELRSVLRTERQKDSLQQLRESFYEDVAEFIAQQKAIRNQKAEELGTHYSPEIRRLTDEIETAEEVVISIYERRVGKVVKAASFAAAGMSSSTEGLTHEEKRLFEDLVTRIEENRATVLSTLEDVAADENVNPDVRGDSVTTDEPTTLESSSPYQSESEMATSSSSSTEPAIPPDEPDPGQTQTDASTSPSPTDAAGDVLADAMGGGADTASDSTDATDGRDDESSPTDRSTDEARTVIGDDVTDSPSPTSSADGAGSNPESDEEDPLSGLADDRQTVRITADVGTIFGVDEREYELAREDVVTLPSANADPLVERGAAEKLE